MKFEITDPVEAHLVLAAVTNAKLDHLIKSAQRGPMGEYSDVCAKVLGRVERRIVDTFIPEPKQTLEEMRWQHRLDEAEMGLA